MYVHVSRRHLINSKKLQFVCSASKFTFETVTFEFTQINIFNETFTILAIIFETLNTLWPA